MKKWLPGHRAHDGLLPLAMTLSAALAGALATLAVLAGSPSRRLVYLACVLVVMALVAGLFRKLRQVDIALREHERVQRHLQQTNRFLESLLDNIPAMIFAKDAQDLRFVRFNRAGEQLLGIPREELLGKNDRDLFPQEQADFFIAKDREVLARGDIVDIPEEEIDTRERGRRTLHTYKVPVRDETGRSSLLLGISMDITEHKAIERRIRALNEELQVHASLLQSSNQELESFCYSVSHDLRAPLRAINGYGKLIMENHAAQLDPEGQRFVRTICNASERMSRLIDDLLEFSRLGRQSLATARVDMAAIVSKVMDEVTAGRTAPRPNISIGELLPAHGDRWMLYRVWLNLLDNAIKYSAGATPPMISISSALHGSEVHYCVKDNGTGFDMRYADKLFGVFQRLHGVDEFPGTGVGLAIVQRIVARHGGQIWAESEPGRGAAFHFTLPVVAAHVETDTDERPGLFVSADP